MPVFRWGHTSGALSNLEQEMERLLEGLSIHLPGLRVGRQYPALNVYDAGQEYLITAEIPGTRVQDLELSVVNGVLTLRGKTGDGETVSEERYRRRERRVGTWERSISLPERVEEDHMAAEFINGILAIHLPKVVAPPARQIPIVEG